MARGDFTVLEAQAARVRELLEEDPADAMLWFDLGCTLLKLGRAGDAVEPLAKATRIDPEHTAAHRDLGRALLESGNPSEAARIFAHAIALAEKAGDHQTGRQIHVLLKRAEKHSEASQKQSTNR
jgi:cytochrome c-type biogenesis protein CcmH/NrfG